MYFKSSTFGTNPLMHNGPTLFLDLFIPKLNKQADVLVQKKEVDIIILMFVEFVPTDLHLLCLSL